MTYPSYAYLTPEALEMALEMARQLHQASLRVSQLAKGGYGTGYSFQASGRVSDRAVAVREWVGPHRDTFDLLFDNEMDSADTTWQRLAEEADEWAQFWATATNARNERLYDEALGRYNSRMDQYQEVVEDYNEAVETDPELATVLSLPSPPTAPGRRPPVSVPTAPGYVGVD